MPSVSPRASQLWNPAALWLWGLGKLLHLPEAVLTGPWSRVLASLGSAVRGEMSGHCEESLGLGQKGFLCRLEPSPLAASPADSRSCVSLYSLCDLGPLQLHHHPPSEHRGRCVDDVSKRVMVLPGGWGCVQSLTSQEGWGGAPGGLAGSTGP